MDQRIARFACGNPMFKPRTTCSSEQHARASNNEETLRDKLLGFFCLFWVWLEPYLMMLRAYSRLCFGVTPSSMFRRLYMMVGIKLGLSTCMASTPIL